MFIFLIEAFATTASFRIPENHTFQQTLPMPPITTLTGIMGAALGLSFKDAMGLRQDKGILLGVNGSHKGEMRDLWKYNKLESGKSLKDVLIREYLTDFRFSIAVGCEELESLSEVKEGFLNPKYALTAGNSDDLLKLVKVGFIKEISPSLWSEFENTVLPGDQTFQYESTLDVRRTPITYRVRSPQVYLLPTDFTYNGRARRVAKREEFTFVGSPVKISNPIPAFEIDGFRGVLL